MGGSASPTSSRTNSRLDESRLRAVGWSFSKESTPAPQQLEALPNSQLDLPISLDDRNGDARSGSRGLTARARSSSSSASNRTMLTHQVWAKACRRAIQAIEAEEIGLRLAEKQQQQQQQQTQVPGSRSCSSRGRMVAGSRSCSWRGGRPMTAVTPLPDQEDWGRQCRRAGVKPLHAPRVKNPGYLVAPAVPLHGVGHADVWVWRATLAAWCAAAKFGSDSPELLEGALVTPTPGKRRCATPAGQPESLKVGQPEGSSRRTRAASARDQGKSRASRRHVPRKGTHVEVSEALTVGDWLKSMERCRRMPSFDPTLPGYDDAVAEMLSSDPPDI